VLTSRYSLPADTTRRVLLGLVAVLLVGFFIQIFGPLRIDTDAGYYLSIAASFADGHGLNLYGNPSPLPVGYPIIVGLIDRAGLAGAPAFVVVNLLFLVAALALLYSILRAERDGSATTALSLIVLLLSTFVIIKYFPRPRSEEASLFASWAALWCLANGRRAHGQRKLWLLLAGALLMVPAISIRAAGVALIPACAWALVPPGIRLIDAEHRARFRCVFLGSAALLGAAVFWAITSTDYVQDWVRQLEAASLQRQLLFTAHAKLNELGQLALNVPEGVIPSALKSGLKITGLIVCLFIMRALWSRRRNLSTVDVFVLANLGILFLWPGDAPRFWLPILPFVGLYVFSVVSEKIPARPRSILAGLYLTIYVALGIGVQVILTREAFSEDFATTYGDSSLSEEYQAVVDGPGHGEIDDADAFRVLLRYDARASEEWDRTKHRPYCVSDDG
jgi:hypothetical protein